MNYHVRYESRQSQVLFEYNRLDTADAAQLSHASTIMVAKDRHHSFVPEVRGYKNAIPQPVNAIF